MCIAVRQTNARHPAEEGVDLTGSASGQFAGVANDASRVHLASAIGVAACLVQRNFTRRKVELGTCARPYGTPCRHEHACLRCPMLQPDPAQAQRLAEIIANLHDRIREATERGWLGEVDGLQVSLTGARQRLQQMRSIRMRAITISTGRPPR